MAQELCSSLHCNVCLMLQAHEEVETHNDANPQKYTQLLNCSGCQMVRYCNRKHQTLDWAIHREFCQAIQAIKKTLNISHPLRVSGTNPKSKDDMEKTIIQLKYLLRNALERPLQYHEEELTSFPIYCPICFSFKNLKILCPSCQNQVYCSEGHLHQHKEEHSKVCGSLKLYYTPYKTIIGKELQLEIKQKVENFQKSDLFAVFEKSFQCKLPRDPTKSLQDYQLFSYAADFSCIASLCYTLSHLDMSSYADTSLHIFIIGSSFEPVLWFREIHLKFFFRQFEEITNLELHFIGPETMQVQDNILQFEYLGKQRNAKYHCFKGLFQDYCRLCKVQPIILAVFNCGFSEFSRRYNNLPQFETPMAESVKYKKDTWSDAIAEMLHYDCPIMFTSFTRQESQFDYAILDSIVKIQQMKIDLERVFKVAKNPYRDLRPLRQWYTGDEESIYYRNGYIQVVKMNKGS
ncbi:uncharacterized protein LOC133322423 [Musca vetustissima]|uniref:uncharacterized protein LOC133322423 n=1 Tax=Musca vetustissima TaxID=27455 RepID=UPI002AB67A8B|nr:uncharacterized protein LOC133322423 [Musca vetustissima]